MKLFTSPKNLPLNFYVMWVGFCTRDLSTDSVLGISEVEADVIRHSFSIE